MLVPLCPNCARPLTPSRYKGRASWVCESPACRLIAAYHPSWPPAENALRRLEGRGPRPIPPMPREGR